MKRLDRVVIDGRWFSLLLVACYFVLLLALARQVGYQKAWERLGVPHMSPIFGDLRVITSAIDCLDRDVDPLRNNPCDPWARPMNYPRIWLWIGSQLHLHQKYSVPLGLGLGSCFFAALFFLVGPLRTKEGFILGVLLCSPPVMFAVERGNIDLLMFICLALALVLTRSHRLGTRLCAYGIVVVAGMLKLYPACGLILCCREKLRAGRWIAAIFLFAFLFYLALTCRDILLIDAATPRPLTAAYGSNVVFGRLQASHIINFNPIFLSWLAVLAAVLLGLAGARYLPLVDLPEDVKDSFRLGATLYVGTFLLGNNWNYRLILLLLLVPGAFVALRDARTAKIGGVVLAFVAALLLLSTAVESGKILFCLKECVCWSGFAAAILLLSRLIAPRASSAPK